MATRPGAGSAEESASTDVVAIVLLVGLVAVGTVGIITIGATTQEETTERLGIQRAETSFQELATRSGTLAHDPSRTGEVDLGVDDVGDDATVEVVERGRIVVTRLDGATIVDRPLGAVEYRSDGGTVAYQGGGVWRGVGSASRPVAAPPLDYRRGTLRVDFVTVDGRDTLGSSRLTLRDVATDRIRSRHLDRRNDVFGITVRSRYYGGWAEYFRDTFENAVVIVDHDRREVSVFLGRFGGGFTVENVLTAYSGDVELSTGNSLVEGDIARDGTVTVDEASDHEGNVTDTPDHSPLDVYIRRAIALARDGSVPHLGGADEIDDPGRYLVDGDLALGSGDELTVDLSGGNVTLLVDGNISIRRGTLRVENANGNRRLRVLTTGNLAMKNGQAFVAPRGTVDARHLQVYGTSDMQVGMVGGSTYFEGIVYAPRETEVQGENPAVLTGSVQCELDGGEADVCISTGNTAVDGAIHAGPAVVKQSTTVRYDPGLANFEAVISPGTAGMASLEHLHLVLRAIAVEQD